ncbi:hypothetical protein [Nostoc sp. FACHB-888]|nr:hypothetical protein [Nostoc sp. FACHB-888]
MNMTQDEHTRYAAIAKRLQLPLSDIIKNLLNNLVGQLGEPLETK